MQESLADIPITAPRRVTRPPQEGIPPTKADRDALLAAVQQYVRAAAPVPPLSLEELACHADRVLEQTGAAAEFRDFLALLINNEVWREPLARVPFHRRLLLLPKCLRDVDGCAAEIDDVGLVCARCGKCAIHDLQAEAERLGYVVLVAEGSPVVMGLLETHQVEAVVGVSCLSVLKEVFPYMHAGAVPGLAVPLLYDGCRETAVDLDWVWAALHLTGDDVTGRLDLDALRTVVEGWFTPETLTDALGPARTETERIAQQWLARSGKRWRPFLTVCAYTALRDEPAAPLPRDIRKLALAIECFHKASLIHDDIEDEDDERYEQKTLHAEHGVAVALNVGDLLLGEGYRLIAECDAPDHPRAEMLRVAAEGHRMLCIGQGLELCWARDPRPLSSKEVLDIFRRKTAPAFGVALHLGAIYAGAGRKVWEVLSDYSQALGIAYQVRDDLDDFADGPDGSDAEAARPSILLAVAIETAEDAERAALEDVWRRRTAYANIADDVRRLFERTDVVPRTRQLLESYKQLALRSLSRLVNANLKGLLRRVVTRIFSDGHALFCCKDQRGRTTRGRE
ncbi:MAG TPA: polyprenyl synthetase family protein [Phycisphaerae bacterium]|nr:polyprenyl synthetase family protein [Phycisphaerae bacterium]